MLDDVQLSLNNYRYCKHQPNVRQIKNFERKQKKGGGELLIRQDKERSREKFKGGRTSSYLCLRKGTVPYKQYPIAVAFTDWIRSGSRGAKITHKTEKS